MRRLNSLRRARPLLFRLMSSLSSPSVLPDRKGSRVSALSRTITAHERSVAFVSALIVAAIAFEPRIRAGGLLSDDWALNVAVKFPAVNGFANSWAALMSSAGSRVGAVPYWLASFTLFGDHTRLYIAMAALLAVIMAFSIFLLLRELRFSIAQSLAMMILTIAAPSVETVRFWFTPSGSQLCLALFFFGLTLALRAFAAPTGKRIRLHAASWGLYLASAVYAEVALPLIAVCILVYLTRAGVGASLRRWALDMIIVVGGYLAALSYVSSNNGFGSPPTSIWGEHARQLGDQALTIFTRMLGPFSDSARSIELIGLGILALAGFIVWMRRGTSPGSRSELKRWAFAFSICLAAIVAVYATYVPASLFYDPLAPGLANRINIATAAPLAIGVVAVLMFARVVIAEILGGLMPYSRQFSVALVAAWFAVIAVVGVSDVRHDAHIWSLAALRNYDELRVLTKDLPSPAPDSTVYAFGEAGTVVLGLPIFLSPWELRSAVKIAYRREDISAYPVVTGYDSLSCGSNGIMAGSGAAVVAPSPYGKSYFFDVPSGRHERIDSESACTAGLSRFHPGPYSATTLEWSQ